MRIQKCDGEKNQKMSHFCQVAFVNLGEKDTQALTIAISERFKFPWDDRTEEKQILQRYLECISTDLNYSE